MNRNAANPTPDSHHTSLLATDDATVFDMRDMIGERQDTGVIGDDQYTA
jgi:hypothetical protein